MEKPTLKPWIEKNIETPEKFTVVQSVRIALPGQTAKKYTAGSPVTLNGMIKKELYFRGLIMYSEDYEKVKEYEAKTKEKFSGNPEATKEASEASVGKLKQK